MFACALACLTACSRMLLSLSHVGWTALGVGWYWTVRLARPHVVARAGRWGDLKPALEQA